MKLRFPRLPGGSMVIWTLLVTACPLLFTGCGSAPKPALAPPDQRVKLLGIPDEYRVMRNPIFASPANIELGRRRYAEYCAECHDTDGSGNTKLGRALYPRPSTLRAASVQAQTDGELFWIIAQGMRFSGMPAGRVQHTEEQMWQLVLYLRLLGAGQQ